MGWTADSVLDHLVKAFVAAPGLPVHSPRGQGATDLVIEVARSVLPSDEVVRLLERARCRALGIDARDLCAARGWPRSTFYEQTRVAAQQVADVMNK